MVLCNEQEDTSNEKRNITLQKEKFMTAIVKPCLSEQDYLAEERNATFKSTYYKGEVFAMAGATKIHNKIAGAVIGELYAHLKGRSCSVMPGDIRVYNPVSTLYTYPGVVISCE